MKKLFTLMAAALFAVSASAKEELPLSTFEPWDAAVVVSGQTVTMTGAYKGGAIQVGKDMTAYDYVWIKFSNAKGSPNFGITYDEWQKNETWGPVFASTTAVMDGSGVAGIKLDKETVMVKGNAETDGVGIGDVYAQHVQQITIQSQGGDASLTVEGIWFGTAAEFVADGGDVPVRPAYGESLVMWEGSHVYPGDWSATDLIDAKYFEVAKVGDIIRCTVTEVGSGFNPIFKHVSDWENFDDIQNTLEKGDTYFQGVIATEAALSELKKQGLRLQGADFTLTKVELINNVKDDGDEPGDDDVEVETELTLTEGHTLLIADLEAAGATDTDVVRFYIVNNGIDETTGGTANRNGWGIGGFANSDNWDPIETWTGKSGESWTYEYTVAKIKEVAGTEPGKDGHGVGITINIYNDCVVEKVTLVKKGSAGDEPGEGGEDGINVVKTQVENGAIYNLAGQKVDENYKGIVIMNGKKYMQK